MESDDFNLPAGCYAPINHRSKTNYLPRPRPTGADVAEFKNLSPRFNLFNIYPWQPVTFFIYYTYHI